MCGDRLNAKAFCLYYGVVFCYHCGLRENAIHVECFRCMVKGIAARHVHNETGIRFLAPLDDYLRALPLFRVLELLAPNDPSRHQSEEAPDPRPHLPPSTP